MNVSANLDQRLKELCLPTIRECFQEESQRAMEESLSYTEYLLELSERECESRRNRRIERNLRASKLPLGKSMESFDLKQFPIKITQQVKSLLEGSFVERKENILAFGKPGSGKTHLLCAIGQELVRKGYRVYFTPTSLLVQELLVAKRDFKLPKKIKQFSRFEVLLLDDLGYVQQTREEMEVLFTLLAERYERGSVMLTSNLPFSKWELIFKDPMTTAAAIDRLVHHSVILELQMSSYRMKAAHARKGE